MNDEGTTQIKVKDSLITEIRKKHPEWKEIPAVYLIDQILRLFLETKE